MTMFPAFLLATVITYAIGSLLDDIMPAFLAVIMDIGIFAAVFVTTDNVLRNLRGD